MKENLLKEFMTEDVIVAQVVEKTINGHHILFKAHIPFLKKWINEIKENLGEEFDLVNYIPTEIVLYDLTGKHSEESCDVIITEEMPNDLGDPEEWGLLAEKIFASDYFPIELWYELSRLSLKHFGEESYYGVLDQLEKALFN